MATKNTVKGNKGTNGAAKMTELCGRLSAMAAELCAMVPSAPSDERATLIAFAADIFELADDNLPAMPEVKEEAGK